MLEDLVEQLTIFCRRWTKLVFKGAFGGFVLLLPVLYSQVSADQPPAPSGSILFWSPDEQVYGYKNIDGLAPTRQIRASDEVLELPGAFRSFEHVTYSHNGQTHSLGDYFSNQIVAGVIVVHRGRIRFEKYGLGNDRNSKWISFSVAKSVTSMLIGAAIQDGFIASVDDPVTDYLPRLRGSSYDNATIKNVLQMASGVDWNEDYDDPTSDVSQAANLNAMALFDYLNTLPVAAKPGQVFNYNTGETNLAGAIVRAAVGDNESSYLERKIWQPFGMESDASWLLDDTYSAELGGCCLNATLRDYARLGLFAMGGGILEDGTRVLPEGWMDESTQPSQGYPGYGYLWWLQPDGSYLAQGIFGQLIWINPATQTVIALHSAWPDAFTLDLAQHRDAMIAALHAEVIR